jgi:hypothetical protein
MDRKRAAADRDPVDAGFRRALAIALNGHPEFAAAQRSVIYPDGPLTKPVAPDVSHDRLPSRSRNWEDTPRATASLRDDYP